MLFGLDSEVAGPRAVALACLVETSQNMATA